MAAPVPAPPTNPVAAAVRRVVSNLDTTQPLLLPTKAVRGILALLIVGGVMAMQWRPIIGADGKPTHWAPPELVLLVSAITGFYFSDPQANVQMRALLSILIVGGTVAFFGVFHWAPEVFVSLSATIIVLYFGQRGLKTNGQSTKP